MYEFDILCAKMINKAVAMIRTRKYEWNGARVSNYIFHEITQKWKVYNLEQVWG